MDTGCLFTENQAAEWLSTNMPDLVVVPAPSTDQGELSF